MPDYSKEHMIYLNACSRKRMLYLTTCSREHRLLLPQNKVSRLVSISRPRTKYFFCISSFFASFHVPFPAAREGCFLTKLFSDARHLYKHPFPTFTHSIDPSTNIGALKISKMKKEEKRHKQIGLSIEKKIVHFLGA